MSEGPKQIEIDQIKIEEDLLKRLKSLKKAERKTQRDFSKFIKRLDDTTNQFQQYHDIMFDASRNYIQMLNQESKIINNNILMVTKEHVKRLEKTINAQKEMSSVLKEMDKTYDEYLRNMDKLEGAWDDLVKSGYSWYSDYNNLIKEKGGYASGGKLNRLEKSIEKNHQNLQKAYEHKLRNHQLVETSYDQLNQVLQKLKGSIRNIKW